MSIFCTCNTWLFVLSTSGKLFSLLALCEGPGGGTPAAAARCGEVRRGEARCPRGLPRAGPAAARRRHFPFPASATGLFPAGGGDRRGTGRPGHRRCAAERCGTARPCSRSGAAAGPAGKAGGTAGGGRAAQRGRPSRRLKAAAETATAEEEPGAGEEAALTGTEEAEAGAGAGESPGAAGQRRRLLPTTTTGG